MTRFKDKIYNESALERITKLELIQKGLLESTNFGFAVYFDDQYTDLTPLVVAEGATVTLDINGATSVKTHLPNDVTDLFDVATSKILPVKQGDGLLAAIAFEAKSSLTTGVFKASIDIGGSFGEIFPQKGNFDEGANVYEPFYFPIVGYQLDTFLANGGILKITSLVGETSIKEPTIQTHRTSVGK